MLPSVSHFVLGMAAACAALTVATPSFATTYRVGPSQTYKTPSAVANLLRPGDVVEIDGNATYAGGTAFWNAGQANSKITVRGVRVNGKRPVLSGGNNTIEAAGDHYVFEGLEITGGVSRCFFHHAHDVTLRDSLVRDCPKQGVLGADSDSGSLLMEYVEVTRCGGGTQDHQIYMATDESRPEDAVFRMQYCYVHDANGGNNVKSRAQRNEIYYNWIEGAMYHELELIGPDGQDPALEREDSDIVGNVLVKNASTYVVRFGGDGTGETGGRYRFVNNTVVVQPGGSAVFRLFDSLQSVEMHNNVFTVRGSGGVNLVRTVEASWTNGEQIAGSNNWIQTGSTNVPSQWRGSHTGSDPGFMDFASLDLRLRATSVLVDAGMSSPSGPPGYPFPSPLSSSQWLPPERAAGLPGSAQPRPAAGTIDIGAFEYGANGGSGGSGGAGGSGSGGAGGAGGSASGGAGSSASGGASGSSGADGSGGASGDGGTTAAGGSAGNAAGGSGSGSGTGGGSGSGGSSSESGGSSGSDTGTGAGPGAQASDPEDPGIGLDGEAGCSCRATRALPGGTHALLALMGLLLARRGRIRTIGGSGSARRR